MSTRTRAMAKAATVAAPTISILLVTEPTPAAATGGMASSGGTVRSSPYAHDLLEHPANLDLSELAEYRHERMDRAYSEAADSFADTTNGTGVRARSTTGNVLEVTGKAPFTRSGTVSVAAGTSAVTVSMAGVTTGSMVFSTAQQDAAVFVRSVVATTASFTIRLTGAAPAGASESPTSC